MLGHSVDTLVWALLMASPLLISIAVFGKR